MSIPPVSSCSPEVVKYSLISAGTLTAICAVAFAIIVCVQPAWFNHVGTIGSCWPMLTGAGGALLVGAVLIGYGIYQAKGQAPDTDETVNTDKPVLNKSKLRERKPFYERLTLMDLLDNPSLLDQIEQSQSLPPRLTEIPSKEIPEEEFAASVKTHFPKPIMRCSIGSIELMPLKLAVVDNAQNDAKIREVLTKDRQLSEEAIEQKVQHLKQPLLLILVVNDNGNRAKQWCPVYNVYRDIIPTFLFNWDGGAIQLDGVYNHDPEAEAKEEEGFNRLQELLYGRPATDFNGIEWQRAQ